MFRGGTPRQKRQQRSNFDPRNFETPLDELTFRLNRLEELTEKIRTSCYDVDQSSSTTGSRGKRDRGLFRNRQRNWNSVHSTKPDGNKEEKLESLNAHWSSEPKARFVTMISDEVEEMVELLRRIAELVIMGEKAGAVAQRRADERRINAGPANEDDDEGKAEIELHIALFENFFERSALGLVVKLVTGAAFTGSYVSRTDSGLNLSIGLDDESVKDHASFSDNGAENDATDSIGSIDKVGPICDGTFLPPIKIAIQAIQSVSILIQNVSRATSLYFLLSNNYVNDLINLPLEQYSIAERFKGGDVSGKSISQRKAGSQEMAELTTHYVTFLKSLALRMNAATLQFFLTYPREVDDSNLQLASSMHFSSETSLSSTNSTSSPIGKPVQVEAAQVEFPLYARALEYCAPHQDRFIRVTAMNICLNTLKLATVSGTQSPEIDFDNAKSPDGSLCNAEALPLRERLAIAQHVCSPNRVEALISPIFTNLAHLWGVLEELIREIDLLRAGIHANAGVSRIRDAKMEKAKSETKRKKLTDSLRDGLANLQDELLLLEDVFRVGLTSLNEQTIEMMLATFVYPLLLQPLLLYMQRYKYPANASHQITSMTDVLSLGAQTGASEAGVGEVDAERIQDAAPAKTALFTMAAVFQTLSNQPLMRLLLTALFHPLAPDSSGETMIRAKPDVAGVDSSGKLCIRVDVIDVDDRSPIKFEKSPYSFGNVTGTKRSRGEEVEDVHPDDTSVYVLSPALTEVLEGKAGDLSLIAKTRSNPYRRAILKCLAAGPSMSGLRQISVLLINAVVNRFDAKFTSDILFGVGMKTLTEDIPLDERNLDSRRAFTKNNRDMGERNESVSRHTMGGGADVNFMSEVVSSLCLSVMNVSTRHQGLWKLVFDGVASHSLLQLAKENPAAMQLASKIIENRRRLACAFVADAPLLMDLAIGAPDESDDAYEDEEVRVGLHLHNVLFASAKGKQFSVVGELLKLKEAVGRTEADEYSVSVAVASKFDDLALRICNFGRLQLADEEVKDAVHQVAATSAMALVQVDALSCFLKDLAATKCTALKGAPAAFTISREGILTSTTLSSGTDVNRSIYSPISHRMASNLFRLDNEITEKEIPETGSIVGLVGRTAIPCVCEIPSSCADLLSDNTVSIVSDGVKWLSLYLVFLGPYMILAEPERQVSGGNGRVITAAHLTRLNCERDAFQPVVSSSPARRLLISYHSHSPDAPGLFVEEKQNTQIGFGPFHRLEMHKSTLDVWFEDESAVEHAMRVIKAKLSRALAKRANRLREKWAKDL